MLGRLVWGDKKSLSVEEAPLWPSPVGREDPTLALP